MVSWRGGEEPTDRSCSPRRPSAPKDPEEGSHREIKGEGEAWPNLLEEAGFDFLAQASSPHKGMVIMCRAQCSSLLMY